MKKIYKVFSILAFSCSRKNDSSNGMHNSITITNNSISDKKQSQYKSAKIEINEIEKLIDISPEFLFTKEIRLDDYNSLFITLNRFSHGLKHNNTSDLAIFLVSLDHNNTENRIGLKSIRIDNKSENTLSFRFFYSEPAKKIKIEHKNKFNEFIKIIDFLSILKPHSKARAVLEKNRVYHLNNPSYYIGSNSIAKYIIENMHICSTDTTFEYLEKRLLEEEQSLGRPKKIVKIEKKQYAESENKVEKIEEEQCAESEKKVEEIEEKQYAESEKKVEEIEEKQYAELENKIEKIEEQQCAESGNKVEKIEEEQCDQSGNKVEKIEEEQCDQSGKKYNFLNIDDIL